MSSVSHTRGRAFLSYGFGMRFTVTYPMTTAAHGGSFSGRADMSAFARGAEAAGFSGIGFTDHPVPSQRWLDHGGHDALDPFAALAFCAAITEHIRLIPNLIVLPYRNPFLTAKAVATVDVLSEGRFTLATAVGYLRSEYTALGVDFTRRGRLFEEYLVAMKRIWTEDNVTGSGSGWETKGNTADPKPTQRPHPPIWIGGNSEKARQRVADHAQGWTPFPANEMLSQTTGTPRLETLGDLQGMLDDLWSRVEAAGRSRDEIDVHFLCQRGGQPGESDFNPEIWHEELAELAAVGVTWVGVSVPAGDVARALDALAVFGDTVISATTH